MLLNHLMIELLLMLLLGDMMILVEMRGASCIGGQLRR